MIIWMPSGWSVASVRTLWRHTGGTWLGSYGDGLTRYKDGTLTRCTTQHGLPDNSICAILRDDAGMLWVNSNRGVFGIREAALVDLAEGRRERVLPPVDDVADRIEIVENLIIGYDGISDSGQDQRSKKLFREMIIRNRITKG